MIHKIVMTLLGVASLVVAVAVSVSNANAHVDCDSIAHGFGTEALCLYAEDSALAGHWPSNPIAGREVADYTENHSEQVGDPDGAVQLMATGQLEKYFNPILARIHYCYVHRKINLCDVYRTH